MRVCPTQVLLDMVVQPDYVFWFLTLDSGHRASGRKLMDMLTENKL